MTDKAKEELVEIIANYPMNIDTQNGGKFGITVGDRLPHETIDILADSILSAGYVHKDKIRVDEEKIGQILAQAYGLPNHTHKQVDSSLIREQVKLIASNLKDIIRFEE